ncbi:MAG: MATE family efflux transporter [Vicinamibacterales bacterium]
MQDLTTGSVTRHILKTTGFMLVTMMFQTLYFLVDLYWVGRLGKEAVAAVSVAGNLTFIVLAATQMLSVGTTTLVSHAVGRKDRERAIFAANQSQSLSIACGIAFYIVAAALRTTYANGLGADPLTRVLAADYLLWFIPAMALQFPMVSMSAALRATGNFKPGMIVQTSTVVINIVLAPLLIFGVGTGHPLGVGGAALATFIALIVGTLWLALYFRGTDNYLHFRPADWRPHMAEWGRMMKVGLPAGAEFALMSVYLLIVYTVSRPFGSAAQAGFGIGLRIVQACFLPVVALGISVAPVAGQNYGAHKGERVRQAFASGALMATTLMLALGALCHFASAAMIRVFSDDPAVIAVGSDYLRISAWNFIASGVIFVASSMFQAMGNTIPPLVTSFGRIALVSVPVVILSRMPGFDLRWIWYLAAASVWVHMIGNLLLLRREFRLRLEPSPQPA